MVVDSEKQAHSLRSPSSRSCNQFRPAFKELASRLSYDMERTLIPSPPPSPPYSSLRRKHLSTGSLGRYFRNSSSISLLKPSTTLYHSNSESENNDYVVINDVRRVPIAKCMVQEVIYKDGKKKVIT